jgi:hypothetical protein
MFRKCCGYYCAMIAAIALFFYSVILVMEIRKNQFVLWKMQFAPDGGKNQTWGQVSEELHAKADHKVVPIIVVLGVSSTFSHIIIAQFTLHIRLHVPS